MVTQRAWPRFFLDSPPKSRSDAWNWRSTSTCQGHRKILAANDCQRFSFKTPRQRGYWPGFCCHTNSLWHVFAKRFSCGSMVGRRCATGQLGHWTERGRGQNSKPSQPGHERCSWWGWRLQSEKWARVQHQCRLGLSCRLMRCGGLDVFADCQIWWHKQSDKFYGCGRRNKTPATWPDSCHARAFLLQLSGNQRRFTAAFLQVPHLWWWPRILLFACQSKKCHGSSARFFRGASFNARANWIVRFVGWIAAGR